MKKKKGFTLIELLAVIVILAVIMVIAVPKILDVIENSRKSAAKSSAELYVEAIELKTAVGSLNSNKYPDKDDYTYDEIKVDIKGEGPTSGIYSLKNGKVVSGNFCVNGYEVVFQNRKTTVLDKCPEDGIKLPGSIKLSSSSANYIYPTNGTFEVTENLSGGTLSCTSSAEEVATCSISGTTVTVIPAEPKTESGYAVLTIISAATEKYKRASASHIVTTAAKLSVTANGYEGSYDGEEHSITVECNDATITYGMTEGIYDLTENPKFIDVGEYIVYYKIEKEGYIAVTGSQTVVIKDNTKPIIGFKTTMPTIITEGDNYSISDYLDISYGSTGGSFSCINDSNTISNLSSLPIGNTSITCTATGTNGLVNSSSINILVFNSDYVSSKAGELIWTNDFGGNFREYYKVNEGWTLYAYTVINNGSNTHTAPLLVSINEPAVTYETKGNYTLTCPSFTTVDYLGHKWYVSSGDAWYEGDIISSAGTAKKISVSGNQDLEFYIYMQSIAKEFIDIALKPTDEN